MNATINTLRITSLLLLQVLCVQQASAADQVNPIAGEELTKQTQIYQSRGE